MCVLHDYDAGPDGPRNWGSAEDLPEHSTLSAPDLRPVVDLAAMQVMFRREARANVAGATARIVRCYRTGRVALGPPASFNAAA